MIPVALIYSVIVVIWFGFGQRIGRAGFYGLFAVAVTVSVQLVGIYLVFGTLILPALGVTRISQRFALPAAYGIATAGYVIGFIMTTALDLPAGPVIVCTLALCAMATAWLSRRGIDDTHSAS